MRAYVEPNNEWYPKIFNSYKGNLFRKNGYTIVSHIESKDYNEKYFFTALIDSEKISELKPNEIGCLPSSSGPHPFLPKVGEEFIPSFWIHTHSQNLHIEPLIIFYESANKSVIWPDQGFLMTYGLIPRFINNKNELIWDDPALPEMEIIKCKPISNYDWGNADEIEIIIKNKYLQDYSTLRNKSIIQIYFERKNIYKNAEIESMLDSKEFIEIFSKNNCYYFANTGNENSIRVEIKGFKVLFEPGAAPLTSGKWSYGELIWPGIENPVTKEYAQSANSTVRVYVSDRILEEYEGKSGFSISPESGAVSYSVQWAVGNCYRIGRNIISVELKKLYEGVPPEVVKLWNSFSVPPPDKEYCNHKNVSNYAKDLIDNFLTFGINFSNCVSQILGEPIKQQDVIGLDGGELRYYGWTSNSYIEVVTRRISEKMNKEQFLQRCKYLYILLVENLSEKILRKTLNKYGIENKLIGEYRSLKLLELILELRIISNNSGLDFVKSSSDIKMRLDIKNCNEYLKEFFALNALRQVASHKETVKNNENFDKALNAFQIDISSTEETYMYAIEIVYEKLTVVLQKINKLFE